MCARRMHADELDIDVALVRRLIEAQLPQWAALPLEPVSSTGTVNAIFLLGEDMAVRLPRVERYVGGLEKELQWLPRLAPHLPLAVPAPLARGRPGVGYPWLWAVYRWLEGETWAVDRVADLRDAAADLARFVDALRRLETTGAPSRSRGGRGAPLAERDAEVRAAIAASRGVVDTQAMTAAWEAALEAPVWRAGPCGCTETCCRGTSWSREAV